MKFLEKKISDSIEGFSYSIRKVLENYGKWFLKMCGMY